MPITLYDLAGVDPALRFSPRCWRTKFALAHKGLDAETVPWRFREAANLPQPNQGRVPVICDGEQVVHDSWTIAEYLEDTYPDLPSLFAGSGGRAHARFVNEWTEAVLLPSILPMIVVDLFQSVDSEDQPYFRANREARLGKTLEAAQADRELRLPSFNVMLSPLRATLSNQLWLGGAKPSYADHVVAAALMWPSCVSRFSLLPADGPIFDWWQRVQFLYDSLAGNAVRCRSA
jgi:glutathione S-transferase